MRYPFKYTFEVINLLPGISQPAQVDIPKEYDRFVCVSISSLVLSANTGITKAQEVMPLLLVNIKPSSEDAGICNVPTPLHAIAGNGAEPHLLDVAAEFDGNTSPMLTVQNISTDITYTKIFVTMNGYREKA